MNKYSSGLVAESFWFIEFKKIVKLRNEGKSWDKVRELCLNENLEITRERIPAATQLFTPARIRYITISRIVKMRNYLVRW